MERFSTSGSGEPMRWLVIGVGNTLRRDDGLGPWLAERVASWELPGVVVRSVHQLTPELALDIAAVDAVLFLDASIGQEHGLRRIAAMAGESGSHAHTPHTLLALLGRLDMHCPPAWLATAPAADLEFGEGLSPTALVACERLVPALRDLLEESSACMKSA
jgi:hydrogenase maturation protease